jgi:hypothetical protein
MKGNFLIGRRYSTTHFHAYLCLPTPTVYPQHFRSLCALFHLFRFILSPERTFFTLSRGSSVCRRSSETAVNTNQLSKRPFPATMIRHTTAVVTSEMSACQINDTSFRYWQKSFGVWSSDFREKKSLQHSKIKYIDSQKPRCKGGVTRESKLSRVLSRASSDDVYTWE